MDFCPGWSLCLLKLICLKMSDCPVFLLVLRYEQKVRSRSHSWVYSEPVDLIAQCGEVGVFCCLDRVGCGWYDRAKFIYSMSLNSSVICCRGSGLVSKLSAWRGSKDGLRWRSMRLSYLFICGNYMSMIILLERMTQWRSWSEKRNVDRLRKGEKDCWFW